MCRKILCTTLLLSPPEGDLFYIENTTRDKVLAVTIDSKHKEIHIRLCDMVIDRENAYGGYFT